MKKRDFLKLSGAAALAPLALTPLTSLAAANATASAKNSSLSLQPITSGISPITNAEREARIKKAQSLMAQHNMAAMIIEPGAAMDYFSGIQWWRSERLTALVIPQKGEVAVVTPFFEQPSVLESLKVGDDVRVWQEHESPFDVVANILKSRGIEKGNIGFESSVRYFVVTGVTKVLPNMNIVAAEPVTRGCRMYKTAAELTLMHKANEVTLRAYEYVFSKLEIGMSQAQVKSLMNSAQQQLGGSGAWCLALFNDALSLIHI